MIKVSIGENVGDSVIFPEPAEVPGADFFQVTVDDDVMPHDSLAEYGVMVTPREGDPVTCELFKVAIGRSDRTVELYPHDGNDDPFWVKYELRRGMHIDSEEVLSGLVASAFALRRRQQPAIPG
jgi:hypothetical protein